MLEFSDGTTPDYRPAIVICAYEAGETGWDPVEDLSGEPWNPPGARTVPVPGGEPETLAATLSDHLGDPQCRALLLVGRTRAGDDFRLQVRAVNRSLDGTHRLDEVGPGVARATAPIADMAGALNDAGLPTHVSSEAEDDAGSYLLYRVLSSLPEGADTPAVGLLRVPEDAADAVVQKAVKTAAQAMARHLSPLPRSRAS
jgi:pyrrolidone-carboxylate peptidase